MESSKDNTQKTESNKQSKFNKLQEQVDEEVREKWTEEQFQLKEQLIEENKFDWYLPLKDNEEYNKQQEDEGKVKLEYIGACDIRYTPI